MPTGVRVVGKTVPTSGGFSWAQSTDWHIHATERTISAEEVEHLGTVCYKICIQIENLLLLVSYNPFAHLREIMWKYTHVPLYPRRGPVSWLIWDKSLPFNGLQALFAFHHSFGLTPIPESSQ